MQQPNDKPLRIAVASFEGMLVNLHLGEAKKLFIFELVGDAFHHLDTRPTPPKGQGDDRWLALLNLTIPDCHAILVAGIGDTPKRILAQHGIRVIEMEGLISDGLNAVFHNAEIRSLAQEDYKKLSPRCAQPSNPCS
ncbi:MAG: hypothetical protein LBU03_00025 [Tannerellaceae bacterium]|nr:hypothetical protein [Tannerellaceae bacterium]